MYDKDLKMWNYKVSFAQKKTNRYKLTLDDKIYILRSYDCTHKHK